MPIHPSMKPLYPPDWPAISARIRFERAGNRCEWCVAANYWPHPETGAKVILTVADFKALRGVPSVSGGYSTPETGKTGERGQD